MKNSKEYSKKIISLYQSLKTAKTAPESGRKIPAAGEAVHERILDAVIYGIISEKFTLKETEAALKRFSEYFVDWNDLRVSRIEEIAEILGSDTPENRQTALTIVKVLQRVFNENHQMSMEPIRKLGKRLARQKLEKMEGLSKFVIDYCMLTSLDSHAIPLTERMIEYLKRNELADENADEPTIEGFLSKQISAKNGYEFYLLLRHESETHKVKAKPDAPAKKAKKAAAKKETAVKKGKSKK
jgi:endonuclease III